MDYTDYWSKSRHLAKLTFSIVHFTIVREFALLNMISCSALDIVEKKKCILQYI